MHDILVFGTDPEEVSAHSNDLTFAKAKEIARTYDATQMQLKAMSDTMTPKEEEEQVNAISKGNRFINQPNQKYTSGRGNK